MYGLMDYYKLNVRLTEKDVSCTGWGRLFRTTTNCSRSLVNEVLQEAHRLARAEAVCKTVPVVKTTGTQIFLAGGQALTSSLLVRLAGTAESMLLVVCTLGHLIDRRMEEYSKKGLAAHAYFLDVAATCIIEAAGRQLVAKIKSQLEACGLKTTIPLGPGHSYWKNLQDQRIIYDLVNPSTIGVNILKSGIMLPKKSLSMVMGIGRQLPPSAENHCYYCSMGRKCPLSRAR
ncbi:Vitamin B12 dependent methionine synthase activation subunit [Desulfofundulus sp.]|uniref:Vitamin B12 dependent methionine synthase activation subunit n=1 Tax=Desulfofundulus sp. TaxID=2282750 RepID=UPI003C729372